MAIKQTVEHARVQYGTSNPNTAIIRTGKIGDLYVNTDLKTLYFAFGLSGTQWGTAGTA
jgi:hypothetical protein